MFPNPDLSRPRFYTSIFPRIGEPWHLRHGNQSLPTGNLRTKEDKHSSPAQRQETFIPAQGEHSRDRRKEPAAVTSQDGCPWWQPAASWSRWPHGAGFDHSFSAGAECLPFVFKGQAQLTEPEPQETVGRAFWNQTDTWVQIWLHF